MSNILAEASSGTGIATVAAVTALAALSIAVRLVLQDLVRPLLKDRARRMTERDASDQAPARQDVETSDDEARRATERAPVSPIPGVRAAPAPVVLVGGSLATLDPVADDERGLARERALMEDYHAQGLAQGKAWFRFSLLFASLGFALIAATVVSAVASSPHDLAAGNIVSLVGGCVVEAVSALFFVQTNRARTLMADFFDRLRADRASERALRVAQQIENGEIRSRLQAALALDLADAPVTDAVMELLLEGRVAGAGDELPRGSASVAADG